MQSSVLPSLGRATFHFGSKHGILSAQALCDGLPLCSGREVDFLNLPPRRTLEERYVAGMLIELMIVELSPVFPKTTRNERKGLQYAIADCEQLFSARRHTARHLLIHDSASRRPVVHVAACSAFWCMLRRRGRGQGTMAADLCRW